MAKAIGEVAHSRGHLISSLKEADVLFDFSHASQVLLHVEMALDAGKPLIIGTTGWDDQIEEAKERVEKRGGTALFSPNFSLGMHYFREVLQKALLTIPPEFERAGLEIHHSKKKDAPSGTSKKLSSMEKDLAFASVRVGHTPGLHSVIFDSLYDTITLTHSARSSLTFAEGAILAGEWIIGKKGWLDFNDFARTLYSTHHPL